MNIAVYTDDLFSKNSLLSFLKDFSSEKNISLHITESGTDNELPHCQDSDIVFLDFDCDGEKTVSIIKKLQTKKAAVIIIAMASDTKYLDFSMDMHLTRFLLKPLEKERVFSALEKAVSEAENGFFMFYDKDKRFIRVRKSDVIMLETKNKIVMVYTRMGTYEAKENMKNLRSRLDAPMFSVPHNSYTVNMNYVYEFDRDTVGIIYPGGMIKVFFSEKKRYEFRRKYLKFIGKD